MTNTYFLPMMNVIQNYAWGSLSSIQTLFDIPNLNAQPQAEIWMGAHPNGCSKVVINGELIRLDDVIAQAPDRILSLDIEKQFGELPYLFKVLAAEKALSIQVHPSKEQAEVGFAKEQRSGLAITASNRNYRDANHKPELVYALTPYQAMNGFRSYQEVLNNFTALDIKELEPLIMAFKAAQNAQGLETLFVALLNLDGENKDRALEQLMAFAALHEDEETYALVLSLKDQYPGDIGLFSPLFLNVLTLAPGQAMFLDACTPHAYIKGTGLEIMANSDNVLRAGLTPKYIDVNELAACTLFEPKARETLLTQPEVIDGAEHYGVPVQDFKFSVYRHVSQLELSVATPEILFALDDVVTLTHATGETSKLEKGQSVFIPADAHAYTVSCAGSLARAYC